MRQPVTPPPRFWESLEYRGRRYVRFPVRVGGHRDVPFTVAAQIADRYAVRDVLTRGGGGVILTAEDQHTGHPVLVKGLLEYDTWRYNLSEPLDDVVEALRRTRHHLQTERRILVQLHNGGCNAVPHPNDYVFDTNPALEGPHLTETGQWWRLDDNGLLDSEPYLVMQHVHGAHLGRVLERRARHGLPEPTALSIIDQVAAVLELLQRPLAMPHGQTWQLVYQDLKPGNVLVDRWGRATVLDFGGCQLMIDGALVLHGSHSRGYCAPECGRTDEGITPSADCYALGSTLFQMLSGINPRRWLPKRSAHSHLPPGDGSGVRADPPAVHIDPGYLSKRCSPQVVDLVGRCVAWEPAARFQTAREFRQALKPLVDS